MPLPRPAAHWLTAAAILIAGAAVTWLLVLQQRSTNEHAAQERFANEVNAATDILAARLKGHANIVAGMRDLFTAAPDLGWQRFNRVADERDFQRAYPEMRRLSFARRVPQADLPAFERRLAAQAREAGREVAGAIIHPHVDAPEHFIVEYLWPWDEQDSIWGLDLADRPLLLAAARAAGEGGAAVASPPITLRDLPVHPEGYTLRYPVWGDADAPGQRPFVGTVTATIRVSDMLDALQRAGVLDGLALRLEDVGTVAGAAPAFMGQTADVAALRQRFAAGEVVRTLEVHGRRWRLSYAPTLALLSQAERTLPSWIAGAGLLFSLVLALAAGLLLRQRSQAIARGEAAERVRRASEERLHAVFEQAAVGMVLVNMTSATFERVNQKYCDILGYTQQELLGRTVESISAPEDQAENLALRASLGRGEITAFHLEKRLLRKDGSQVWVDLTVSPVVQQDETIRYNIGVIQDITERRAMREALRENEQRLRAILNHLPVGIVVWQRSGGVVYRNRQFVEITGYDEARLSHVDQWWRLVYPDQVVRERMLAQSSGGSVEWSEHEVRCADGETKPLGISGVRFQESLLLIVEDLSLHRAAEDEINYLASYDRLTGLANRRLLTERLDHVLAASAANGQCGAVLMLDLDHFKTLNETRGHDCGDALLRQVAVRLRGCVGADDMLARHGDDEFVVVLAGAQTSLQDAATHARAVSERILAALRAPFALDGEHYHSTASVGAAVFRGSDEKVDELLQRADMAMYQAKAAGRDTLCFYDPQIQQRVQARVQLERDLRAALEQRQFELHYQAQVQGGAITGAEALLRWRHPVRGFISPAEFIPLAEDTGLILAIGQWVLETACAQLAAWAGEPLFAALKLAVNISPRQFSQSDFVALTLAAVASSGADPRRLELELTEGLLLQDLEGTIAKMTQLKAYGLDFSLDDFGTGYSSLAYLKRLPLDQLKIDQSFVRDVLVDPNDAAIARTIVALGTSLNLRVIAEGVETEAQRAFLQRHGCDTWQGYLFSKPLPVDAFTALVRRSPAP
ncbi:MAG: hypothetical protein ABS45_06055 [Comamonas sp. SCN 65-56]|nr:MAG: hypothetical protein ABS45_06055 [Comamonas sp. SCN 65-56]